MSGLRLRISDEDLATLIDGCWIEAREVRAELEARGIEAPQVTLDELAMMIASFTCDPSISDPGSRCINAAHAVLAHMQRRTVSETTDSTVAALHSACDGYRQTIAQLEARVRELEQTQGQS